MELRHLDVLLAIEAEGSFTAAADALNTVQSNVSEQVRQLEDELGVELLVRGRKGARPTECGDVVLERARRIRRELDGLREDVSMLQGLEAGTASFGVVGTASRWLVPALVADMRGRASGVSLRIVEGASERLVAEVLGQELALALVTEPVMDARVSVEHLMDEALVGLVGAGVKLPPDPVPLQALAQFPMILPPPNNPLRIEIDAAAHARGFSLSVPVEVEGIRLISDLVAAGAGVSVLPETATAPASEGVRRVTIADMPPRRLALVCARDSHLSLADRAVRDCVLRIVAGHART
ncbi:MAG TPA: LysR substrate-binding domain-containing protein [Acidimicrobiia bacterium]|nr:LysR substrate-binding domain-containing protein [Acidimicrobiia bacterium]